MRVVLGDGSECKQDSEGHEKDNEEDYRERSCGALRTLQMVHSCVGKMCQEIVRTLAVAQDRAVDVLQARREALREACVS